MILYQYPFTLSVVLSIHSEDLRSVDRIIGALKDQCLSKRHWRLVVVSDAEKNNAALAEKFTWHPRVSIVQGNSQGNATLAMRALMGCRTDLVAYVDGRTRLAPDYLEQAIRLAAAHPFVGLFGGHGAVAAGSGTSNWQGNVLRLFGIRSVTEEKILQTPDRRFMPGPSGFIIRREHLRRFGHILRRHPFFQEAGFAAHREDFDFRAALARTVVQSGFSLGLFPQLQHERILEHRDLNERRVQERLRQDAFSRVVERYVWTGILPEVAIPTKWEKITLRWFRAWQIGRLARLRRAHRAGVVNALSLAMVHATRPTTLPMPPPPPVSVPSTLSTHA